MDIYCDADGVDGDHYYVSGIGDECPICKMGCLLDVQMDNLLCDDCGEYFIIYED